MADSKISALPASTVPLVGTEVLPIVQGGATKQVSVANLTAGRTQTSNGIVQGTAATGYNFTATTPASGMTSRLLNNYEEGTWVPNISFGNASVGVTSSTAAGYYTRIGNMVHVSCLLVLTNKGSSTGSARVTGLPFTVANNSAAYSAASFWFDLITYVGMIVGYGNVNLNTIDMLQTTALGANSALTEANFANGTRLMINLNYRCV